MSRWPSPATAETKHSRATSATSRIGWPSASLRRWLRQARWLCDSFRPPGGSRGPRSFARRASSTSRPGVAGLQLLDIETYLPGDLLLKADLASMAHSLELRSPFLDHEVVALGLALPDSLKTRGREGKVALRGAFAADLPAEVAGRGKSGFGVPLGRWFRSDLRDVAHDLLSGERGWFR